MQIESNALTLMNNFLHDYHTTTRTMPPLLSLELNQRETNMKTNIHMHSQIQRILKQM